MVRCIVKSCPNQNEKCRKAEVSFFRLPTNEIIRDNWFRKIGEVCLPSSIKNAKICSAHFTKESFHIGKNQRAGKCTNARRLLLPTACPSIMLSAMENKMDTVMDTMNFKVIRREFLLPTNVHKSTDEGSSSSQNPVSTFWVDADDSSMLDNESSMLDNESKSIEVSSTEQCADPLDVSPENASPELLSISETVVNVKTPKKSHVRREWVDNRTIFETPKSTFHASDSEFNYTFPRRSQRVKYLRSHRSIVSSVYKRTEKRQVRSVKNVKKKVKMPPKKLLREYHSDDSTSPCIRKQRFMMENCNRITNNIHKSAQNEDPYKSMMLLKAELEHYRSMNKFHLQSRSHHSDEMKEIEKKCQTLRLQLAQKDEGIQDLIKEKEEMKVIINDLCTKLMASELEKQNLKKTAKNEMRQLLQRYFTEGQIRCIIENRKWIRWSIDDYASAIAFRSVSPKAYRYFRLKLNFPLPSLASLRRWALRKFDIREGFLSDVLAIMREKSKTFTSLEKITIFTFDEMPVSSDVQSDSKIKKVIGPYGKVQVIMARGLLGNWKQPIYYKFDQPMTKDILMKAVCHLYNAGYEVVATISNMDNKVVWTELHITPENHFFTHPMLEDGKIFVFADVPHLLKLLRNWFIDEGFLLQNCSEPFKAEVLQAIIDTGDLRIAHRLTQQILDARHSPRQTVKPAPQIWSYTVAKAIKRAGDCGVINVPDYKTFSDFVLTVNNWFDVHNSQQKCGAHSGVNGFGVSLNNQESILIKMNLYIQNMKVGSRNSLMPFQKGILISNASLRGLYDYLKNKYPQEFKYILTRHLQQDTVKNFFAYIRTMGSCKDHLSRFEFRYRLRWCILGKHSHAVFSLNRNSEDVDTNCMSSTIDSSSSLSEILSTIVTSNILSSSTVISTPKSSSCETSQNIICNASNDHSYSEMEDHSQNEIILTNELFSSIINISPEQLEEDSAHNNDDEKNMDDDDDDLNIRI